jgi:hypothetical protein
MNERLQDRLTIVGHIGYDVYIVSNDRVYVRPAGSAYNAACGVLAVRGECAVIASLSPSMNRTYLEKLPARR